LEAGPHPRLNDLVTIIPISVFTLGWIAFTAVTIRAKTLSGRAPILVIAGFSADCFGLGVDVSRGIGAPAG
jgi:hypothetical protein